MQEILIYGIKGYAAYADHALILGRESDEIYAFTHKALAATLDHSLGLMDFVGLAMECGRINLVTMELLNKAHTDSYGHPVPTPVQLGTKAGKAILVSGHDLRMLEELLKQTEGKGINIYTHGEMLPAHGYPGLKKYAHLAGNFGGAWQDQHKEFQQFPGAIIFNTNCIQRPAETYKDRLFTWGLVQWPDVKHVDGWDFSDVIARAQEGEGFPETPARRSSPASATTPSSASPTRSSMRSKAGRSSISSWSAAATAPNRAATTTPSSPSRRPRTRSS